MIKSRLMSPPLSAPVTVSMRITRVYIYSVYSSKQSPCAAAVKYVVVVAPPPIVWSRRVGKKTFPPP